MKIVYFGTDVFLSSFRYLAEREEVLALYTYHNGEDYFTEHQIVREARSRGIPVTYGRISEDRVRRYFEDEGCELFFSAEYGYIIPVPTGLASFRGINIHSSLLPEGRGYYPIECAMERGLARTGVTMHKISLETDAGDVLFREPIEISPEMDSVDVYLESSRRALEMTKFLFANFEGVWNAAHPQERLGERWAKPAEGERTVGHGMTVAEALATHRRFNQMTLVRLDGRLHHVVTIESGGAALPAAEVEVAPGRFLYALSDGHLRLTVLPQEENLQKVTAERERIGAELKVATQIQSDISRSCSSSLTTSPCSQ